MELDLKKCLALMVERKASDLHLKVGTPPVIRKTRFLQLLIKDYPSLTQEELSYAFEKILSPQQKNTLYENRQVDFSYGVKKLGRFRFNIFFQRGTLRAVIRHIPFTIPTFKDLHLPDKIKNLADNPINGLILVTGSTGMGKSSTIVSMLNHINQTKNRHIITIEDPIEFLIKDNKSLITQRELGTDYLNYGLALKSSLRQDPDIIFFGELRDPQSTETALNAANTGHLVFSTLHTNNVAESITRVLGFFSKEKSHHILMEFSSCLRAIICQRLLVRKDGKSFIPAVEILINNPRIRSILEDPSQSTSGLVEVIESSRDVWGMQSFNQHLIELYQAGHITQEASIRASDSPEKLRLHFSGFSHENKQPNTVLKQVEGNQRKWSGETQELTLEVAADAEKKKKRRKWYL